MLRAVAIGAGLAGVLLAPGAGPGAWAQDAAEPAGFVAPDAAVDPAVATPVAADARLARVRADLAARIATLERDIVALGDLLDWQEGMAKSAAQDPAGTLLQRRPMARCISSPLAPVCDRLPGLFVADEAEVVDPVDIPAPTTGEARP